MLKRVLAVLILATLSSACTDKGGNDKIVSDIFIKNETSHRVELDFSGVIWYDDPKLVVLLDSGQFYKNTTSGYSQDVSPLAYISADSVTIVFDDSLEVKFNFLENNCQAPTSTVNPLCPDAWDYNPVEANDYYSTAFSVTEELYGLAR